MRAAAFAAAALGALASSLGAQSANHARSVIPIAGETLERRFADADGDGLLDLFLAVSDGAGGRSLLVHRQREGGAFPAQPDERIQVPRAVVCWTAGRFTVGSAASQVVYLARDAAFARGADGGLRRIAAAPMLLDMPADDALPWWPHAADLDGDGLDELVLATEEGFEIVGADGAARGRLPFETRGERNPAAERAFFGGSVRATLSSQELSDVFVPNDDVGVIESPPALYSGVRLPAPVLADADGDGRKDLTFFSGGEIVLHLQGADGTFAAAPSLVLRLEQDSEADDARLEWVNLDGNRAADLLLLRQSEGGATSFATDWQVRIWTDPALRHVAIAPAEGEGEPAPEGGARGLPPPSVFLKAAASSLGAYVMDLNGDGRADVGLSAWDLDVPVIGGGDSKLRHETSGYLAQAGGGVSARPAFAVLREFALADLEALRDVPAFAADLTGDGRADLVESTKSGNVEVRAIQQSGGGWAPSDAATYRVPVDAKAARLEVQDLNRDRIGDFVVVRAGQVEIYLSRGR